MLTQTHRVSGEETTVYFPETDADFDSFEDWLVDTRGVLGLDTETTGLHIYGADYRCRLVQIGNATEAWVLRTDRFAQRIKGVFVHEIGCGRNFVAHNAPFDLLVLDRVGLADLADLGPCVFDTYILAHLCDPRTEADGGAGLSLKALSAIYVDQNAPDTQTGLYAVFHKDYKATKATGWALIDIDHPLYVLYAGLDVIFVSRLLKELGTLIKANGLSALATWEHRVQLVTTRQQRRGLRIDVDYTHKLIEGLADEEQRHKHTAASFGVDNINSTRQVTEALLAMGETWSATTGTGAPSVGKDVLLPMADLDARSWERLGNREPNPLADAVTRAKRASKWTTSYGQAFLDLRDEQDRIHPFIKSLAARTARMSVSTPPLQQLPSSDWTIRRAIIADPGQTIIAADYRSMELRVLAALADVKEMKTAIREERDLHDFTATLLYGDGFTKNQRRLAKGVGLGKVFGGGATGLAKQIGAPLDQVQYAVSRYDEVYPEVNAYSKALQRRARFGGGAVVTPIGRQIPLDRDRSYACVNYVVQSTARDLIARALLAIEDAGMGEHVLLPVHDELVCQAPTEDAADVIAEIGRLMKTTFQGVEIDSDTEVYGPTWGHGYGAPA
jgi:DNA polymerase-1